LKYLILSLAIFLSGCDIILDEVFDCLDNDGPEFKNDHIPPAVLNQVYYARINAAIHHEPHDNAYNYQYSLSGDLPRGVSLYTSNRYVELRGTPVEHGSFYFKLTVRVTPSSYSYFDDDDSYDDGDSLCTTIESKNFVLSVTVI